MLWQMQNGLPCIEIFIDKYNLSIKMCHSFYTSGPPSVPRRGRSRDGASVASLRTPQNKHTSSGTDRSPGSFACLPRPRKQSGGAGAALTRLRLPALSVRFLLFLSGTQGFDLRKYTRYRYAFNSLFWRVLFLLRSLSLNTCPPPSIRNCQRAAVFVPLPPSASARLFPRRP